jgi:hypothetical protein
VQSCYVLCDAYSFSIVNVKAQLLPSVYRQVSHPALHFRTSSITLEVSLVGDYFELLGSTQAIARVNKSFCNEARRLVDLGIKFSAYLQKKNWDSCCRALQNSSPDQSATTFAVDISVHSFRHHADRIGDVFSQAGFFLQRPSYDFSEDLYYNPQLLEIEGFEAREETVPSFTREPRWNQVEASTIMSSGRAEPEGSKNAPDLVDSILNSLSHSGILHEIQTDQNEIKAPLLPYAEMTFTIRENTANGGSDIR